MRDTVDEVSDGWAAVRPDVDVSPIQVVLRLSRASRLLERRVKEYFASEGVEPWEFDILSPLRRAGEPYTLSPGDFVSSALVGSPALTNRLDRLVEKGLDTRQVAPTNRRKLLITLTARGLELVDRLLDGHMANERRLLEALNPAEQRQLATLAKKLLVSLGDSPTSS
jgi:DNA-binding MarR family transcriptional regulator